MANHMISFFHDEAFFSDKKEMRIAQRGDRKKVFNSFDVFMQIRDSLDEQYGARNVYFERKMFSLWFLCMLSILNNIPAASSIGTLW